MSTDPLVTQPGHYTSHPIFTGEQFDYSRTLENGPEYSAFRYFFRYASKGKPLQDVEKGIWYLEKIVDHPDEFQPVLNEMPDGEDVDTADITLYMPERRYGALAKLVAGVDLMEFAGASKGDQLAALICVEIMRGIHPDVALDKAEELRDHLLAGEGKSVEDMMENNRRILEGEARLPLFSPGKAFILNPETGSYENLGWITAEGITDDMATTVVGGTSPDEVTDEVTKAYESVEAVEVRPVMFNDPDRPVPQGAEYTMPYGGHHHVKGTNTLQVGRVRISCSGPGMFQVAGRTPGGEGIRTRAAIDHFVNVLNNIYGLEAGDKLRISIGTATKKYAPEVTITWGATHPDKYNYNMTPRNRFNDLEVALWAIRHAAWCDWQAQKKTSFRAPGEYSFTIVE